MNKRNRTNESNLVYTFFIIYKFRVTGFVCGKHPVAYTQHVLLVDHVHITCVGLCVFACACSVKCNNHTHPRIYKHASLNYYFLRNTQWVSIYLTYYFIFILQYYKYIFPSVLQQIVQWQFLLCCLHLHDIHNVAAASTWGSHRWHRVVVHAHLH